MQTSTVKFLVLIPLFGIVRNINGDDPIVDTKVGLIRGTRVTDEAYNQFLGIPYAKVNITNPFGQPLPQPVFEGVFDALDDTSICPQIEEFNFTIVGTLDCLNLNIYVPTSVNSTDKLPVMVYIYGGGFSIGFAGTFLYGPKYLVRHDVILVTFNYRLGPYGFMCLDTPEVPGNQGLKDQMLALRWIRKNIESFGGDVDKITVFGNSAGGISTNLHLLSLGEKLFTRMILQSGSAFYPSIVGESDTAMPLKLAEQLGSATTDLNEALSIIAAADPASVIEARAQIDVQLGPCKEKFFPDVENFIKDYPINLPISKAEGVSILLGINNRELLSLANLPLGSFEDANYFYETLENIFRFELDDLDELEYLVRRFYIGDKVMSQDVMWEIIDFRSDTSFVYAADRSINIHLDNGAENIFYYMFSYSGGRNFVKRKNNITVEGAAHADEIGYLFDMDFIPEVPSYEDQLILDRMTAMWANFAKYGDPTPQTSELLPIKWEPITKGSVYHYLNIDSELSAEKRPFHHRMAFWDLFYKSYRELEKGFRIDKGTDENTNEKESDEKTTTMKSAEREKTNEESQKKRMKRAESDVKTDAESGKKKIIRAESD